MNERSDDRKISVAMCTFNGERFVEDQLRSILQQSRPPDELVVCDDGSVDGTLHIIERFVRKASFPVRLVVNDRRLGSTENFEKAISLCRGSEIALCDQDDVWDREKLHLQERALRSDRLGAVFSDAEVVAADLSPLGYRLWEAIGFSPRDRLLIRNGSAVRLLLKKDVVTGATLLFSSVYRDAVLPIPSGWRHDAWIALVIGALGGLGFLEAPLIKYRQHAGNQIGAAPGAGRTDRLLQALGAARGSHSCAFLEQFERYSAGSKRLRKMVPFGVDVAQLAEVEAKTAHLRERADLAEAVFHRFPIVLRELLSGRYHRYSGGWRSVGKDLLLRR